MTKARRLFQNTYAFFFFFLRTWIIFVYNRNKVILIEFKETAFFVLLKL